MSTKALYPRLLGDVGGTNARFGWQSREGAALEHIHVLPCADHADIALAIEAYLARAGVSAPAAACIGIANPVTGDQITMTNHHWSFSIQALQKRLSLQKLKVINDFTALALALLYSVGAHGIMTLNDFKAIEGDRQMGVDSLPVQLGAQGAARVACLFMWVPQVVVAALLFNWQLPWHALAVLVLSFMQWPLMWKFLKQPVERALYVSAFGVPMFVSGMMVSAWGLRQLNALGLV